MRKRKKNKGIRKIGTTLLVMMMLQSVPTIESKDSIGSMGFEQGSRSIIRGNIMIGSGEWNGD